VDKFFNTVKSICGWVCDAVKKLLNVNSCGQTIKNAEEAVKVVEIINKSDIDEKDKTFFREKIRQSFK